MVCPTVGRSSRSPGGDEDSSPGGVEGRFMVVRRNAVVENPLIYCLPTKTYTKRILLSGVRRRHDRPTPMVRIPVPHAVDVCVRAHERAHDHCSDRWPQDAAALQ